MAPIGKETPVTLRVGVVVAVILGAAACGGWMQDVAASLRSLPRIQTKIEMIDKEGTQFGRTGDLLIRKDIESLSGTIAEIRMSMGKQWDLMRSMDEKIDGLKPN